jgi:putative endonuclease
MNPLPSIIRNPITRLFEHFRTGELAQPKHIAAGIWGEDIAARHLREKGYRILGQRVHVGRKDEFDIIARDLSHNQIVFVEVKTRKSEGYGRPISAVNKAKRLRMSRAAVRYLKNTKARDPMFRFDVIEVVGEMGDETPKLTHTESAFSLDSRFTFP